MTCATKRPGHSHGFFLFSETVVWSDKSTLNAHSANAALKFNFPGGVRPDFVSWPRRDEEKSSRVRMAGAIIQSGLSRSRKMMNFEQRNPGGSLIELGRRRYGIRFEVPRFTFNNFRKNSNLQTNFQFLISWIKFTCKSFLPVGDRIWIQKREEWVWWIKIKNKLFCTKKRETSASALGLPKSNWTARLNWTPKKSWISAKRRPGPGTLLPPSSKVQSTFLVLGSHKGSVWT